MDKDTWRFWIGLGVTVVGIGLSIIVDQIPMWVGYAIALAGGMAMVWPVIRVTFTKGSLVDVPMAAAAQAAYNAAETNIMGKSAYGMSDDEDQTLGWFFHSFIYNDVPIYGMKPPSTVLRRIPREEAKKLHPRPGLKDAFFPWETKKTAYTQLSVRRWDMWRAVRSLKKAPKHFPPRDMRG